MERRKSAGLYLTAAAFIATLICLISYLINTNTKYFKNLGVMPLVVIALIVVLVANCVYIFIGLKKQPLWADALPVVSTLCVLGSFLAIASSRVNVIAAVLTFENNAQNMADLKSAIVGIVACIIAVVLSIVASFFDVTVEKE